MLTDFENWETAWIQAQINVSVKQKCNCITFEMNKFVEEQYNKVTRKFRENNMMPKSL